jgi:hypothetical protein
VEPALAALVNGGLIFSVDGLARAEREGTHEHAEHGPTHPMIGRDVACQTKPGVAGGTHRSIHASSSATTRSRSTGGSFSRMNEAISAEARFMVAVAC